MHAGRKVLDKLAGMYAFMHARMHASMHAHRGSVRTGMCAHAFHELAVRVHHALCRSAGGRRHSTSSATSAWSTGTGTFSIPLRKPKQTQGE